MNQPAQPMEIVSFPVEGMTCASCVNRITRFLGKVEGVEEAHVNLASEAATVRFDPARTAVTDLAAAVDAAGYVARIEQAASGDEEREVADMAEARSERDEASVRHVAALRIRLIVAGLPGRRCHGPLIGDGRLERPPPPRVYATSGHLGSAGARPARHHQARLTGVLPCVSLVWRSSRRPLFSLPRAHQAVAQPPSLRRPALHPRRLLPRP
jgi:copper ion binding protein